MVLEDSAYSDVVSIVNRFKSRWSSFEPRKDASETAVRTERPAAKRVRSIVDGSERCRSVVRHVPGSRWLRAAGEARVVAEAQQALAARNKRIAFRADYRQTFLVDTECTGDRILESILTILDSYNYERTPIQKLWHWWYLQAILPFIYGEEWEAVAYRVLREHGLEKIRSEVLAMAPRRMGKTISIAMLVAAVITCVPGIRVAVFSTGRRASTFLTQETMRFVSQIPGAKNRIVKDSAEEIQFATEERPPGCGVQSSWAKDQRFKPTTSTLLSLPGSATGTSVCVHAHDRGQWRLSEVHV